MKKKAKKHEDGSFWDFALINKRLAEFHYEISKGKFYITYGHCYVKRSEYKTKLEYDFIFLMFNQESSYYLNFLSSIPDDFIIV